MKKELQDRLLKTFPRLYRSDPDSRFAEDGFAVGDGWFDIIRKLSEQLTALDEPGLTVLYVKEKMRGLDVALRKNDERTFALVTAAHHKSMSTCEMCGAVGRRVAIGRSPKIRPWFKTLCGGCAAERGRPERVVPDPERPFTLTRPDHPR